MKEMDNDVNGLKRKIIDEITKCIDPQLLQQIATLMRIGQNRRLGNDVTDSVREEL